MGRLLCANLFSVALVLAVSSCGGSNGSNSGAGQTAEPPSEPPPSGSTPPTVIQGTDANSDGIWDSVEAKIEVQYGIASEKSSARRMVSALQSAVLAGAGQGEPAAAVQAVSKASNCLYQTFGEQGAYEAADFLESQVADTEDRARAYLRFNFSQAGHASSFDPAFNYCE